MRGIRSASLSQREIQHLISRSPLTRRESIAKITIAVLDTVGPPGTRYGFHTASITAHEAPSGELREPDNREEPVRSRAATGLSTLLLLVVLLVVAYLIVSNSGTGPQYPGPTPAGPPLPGVPTTQAARSELAGLAVAAAGTLKGYDREHGFPLWSAQGNKCDTREVVIKRDGQNVKTDVECKAVSGTWVSPYDNKQITNPRQLDIDHIVPLAEAWRSGADKWNPSQREKFANDLTDPQLLAVSATTNRAKGDKPPDQWKPPNTGYWCTYAKAWIHVKSVWKLSITSAEKSALNDMLGRCPA
jgi:Protein of unknown function (DUF1524)